MVDEAEDSMLGQANKTNKRTIDSPPSSPGPRKRKPGEFLNIFTLIRESPPQFENRIMCM